MSIELSRRDFIGTCSAAACSVSLGMAEASVFHPGGGYTGTLCLFSKPLPGMGWRRLAQAAKSVGFGGIDLTVRRGGHVQPERATEDLPKAVEAIREERSEEHTSELQSLRHLVCRLLLEKKKKSFTLR